MRILVFALLTLSSSASAQRPTDGLGWLAGCWERRTRNGVVEEQWMAPRGGELLGMSRTTRGDSVAEWEFLRIYAVGDTLVYAAQPSRQPPAEFRMRASGTAPSALRFENPTHDFPQRILYRTAGDSLIARVEGKMNGQERGVDFPYVRVECGVSSPR